MDEDLFKCALCDYKTTRRFNFNRHQRTAHIVPIPTTVLPNNNEVLPNIDTNAKPLKCPNCYKTFVNKYSLERHQPICKRVSQPNECQYCHKVYSCQPAKSYHEKSCKHKGNEREEPQPPTQSTQPSTQPTQPPTQPQIVYVIYVIQKPASTS